MGREELRLAKTAAREAGISLSAFVTEAVRGRLVEKRRKDAALEVLRAFAPEDFPAPDRERELLEQWSNVAGAEATSRDRTRRKSHANVGTRPPRRR